MAESFVLPRVPATIPLYFTLDNFQYDFDSFSMVDLQNENLFPISKIRFSQKSSRPYKALEPAFLLASKFILELPQTFAMVIARRAAKENYVTEDDILPRDSDEIQKVIRSIIPDVDIDPDMSERSEEYAMTYLESSKGKDLLTLDSHLITAVLNPANSLMSKRLALFTIAFLLCHELAHILEFRCIRQSRFTASGQPHPSPPGLTCMEVGSAWEIRTFGAVLTPVCFKKGDLSSILGCVARSSSWNYHYMAVPNEWVSRLFQQSFWNTNPKSAQIPFQSIIAIFPEYGQNLDDEFSDDPSLSGSPRKKRRGEKGEVLSGSPPKGKTRGSRSSMVRHVERKKCGGKILVQGPIKFRIDESIF